MRNVITGTLTQLDVPGHFDQQLIFFGIPTPAVDYNIIYIDDEAAVEYDCNESIVNYGTKHNTCQTWSDKTQAD